MACFGRLVPSWNAASGQFWSSHVGRVVPAESSSVMSRYVTTSPSKGHCMPKLDTVQIRHRRSGKTRKINSFDYYQVGDSPYYNDPDWEVVSERRGSLSHAEQVKAQVQSEKEFLRPRLNPDHPASKTFEDRYNHNQPANLTDLKTDGLKTEDSVRDEMLARKDELDSNWTKRPWMARRVYVKNLTGASRVPKNAAEAEAWIETWLSGGEVIPTEE